MSSGEADSSRASPWPRLLIAAAALAYGVHLWVVRADLLARNAVLPLLGAVFLLIYFWGLGVALFRLPALRREGEEADPLPDPLVILAAGIGAGALALLGLASIGLLQLAVFAPIGAAFALFGLWRAPPWRLRGSSTSSFRLSDTPLLAALGVWALLVLVLAFAPDATWDALAYHLATA
jgi:multisubunit Na+/H+ antiporter MnhC subunit